MKDGSSIKKLVDEIHKFKFLGKKRMSVIYNE